MKGFADLFLRGLIVGLVAAVAVALVAWAMGGDVDLPAIFGWWTILGICLSFFGSPSSLSPLRGVGGFIAAAALVVTCSVPSSYLFLSRLPLLQTRPLQLVGLLVGCALDAPDVPARF